MKKFSEKFSKARNLGAHGEPGKPEFGALEQFGYRIGQLSLRALERDNKSIDLAKKRELDDALNASFGINKTSLEIIRAAALIPHQASSYPGWASLRIENAKNRPIGQRRVGETLQWHNYFRSSLAPYSQDKSRTPLALVNPIGEMMGVDVSIMLITVESPLDTNLAPGPTSTILDIGLLGEIGGSPTQQLRVDAQGTVHRFKDGIEINMGSSDQDFLRLEIDNLLGSTLNAVQETAAISRFEMNPDQL